ncbi:unnamed protein product [Brachionus calyciflorus]|uniref:C2 domain-containing protein n=1 Tax=Brachionus calyciflorus TaxID=104777 RepID=A0A813U7U3_9BILA|nr:unnamed protein product [Brachionus calyciflorus]
MIQYDDERLYQCCLFSIMSKVSKSESHNELLLSEYVQRLFEKDKDIHDLFTRKILKIDIKYYLCVNIKEARDLFIKDASLKFESFYCLAYVADLNLEKKVKRKKYSGRSFSMKNSEASNFKKSSLRNSLNEIYTKSQLKNVYTTKLDENKDPKWNEEIEMEIPTINKDQEIVIDLYGNSEKNFEDDKYFFKKLLKPISFETRKLSKNFIGQVRIPFKTLKDCELEWFDLKCRHNDINHKKRGQINLNFWSIIKYKENSQDKILSNKDRSIITCEYRSLATMVYTYEVFESKHDTLSNTSIQLLSNFCNFYNIPTFTKDLIELIELINLFNCNLISLDILVKNFELLNKRTDNTNKYIDSNEIETIAVMFINSFFRNYMPELTTFPFDQNSILNLKLFLNEMNIHILENLNNQDKFFHKKIRDMILTIIDQIYDYLNEFIKNFNLNKSHKASNTLIDKLSKKVQEDVSKFVAKKVNLESVSENNEIYLLKWMSNINVTISYLNDLIETDQFKKHFLNKYINFTKLVSISISISLSGPVQFVLKCLNEYQSVYREFKSNMNTSSRVSYDLYLNCRKINTNLSNFVPERESFKLKLNNYNLWFKEKGIVMFWLETYKIVSKNFIEKAVLLEDTKEISEDNPVSMTSILIADHLITMCNEWKEINFQDIEMRFIGTASLNEIIGDCCRNYLFNLKKTLEQNNFFFTQSNSNQDKLNSLRKICICVNNIFYIKKQVVSKLENLLRFDETVNFLNPVFNENYLVLNLNETLRKSVVEAVNDIESLTKSIVSEAGKYLVDHVKNLIVNFYMTKNHVNLMDFFDECYHILDQKLPYLNKMFMFCSRNQFIKNLCELLPQKENAIFYQNVFEKFQSINEIFVSYNLTSMLDDYDKIESEEFEKIELELLKSIKCIYKIRIYKTNLKKFLDTLKTYSIPTSQYILEHLNYLNNFDYYSNNNSYGSIYFKVGYENVQNSIKITLKILCCSLNPSERNEKISYFVTAELLPSSIFGQNELKLKTKLLNKINNENICFNQSLIFENLNGPSRIIEGASLRLSLWSKNKFGVEKCIGECFYEVKLIENMESLVSINEMYAVIKNLRGLIDDEFEKIQELMRRGEFDIEAKNFVDSRKKLQRDKCMLSSSLENSRTCFDGVFNKSLSFLKEFKCFQINT